MKVYKFEYCVLSKQISFSKVKAGEMFYHNGNLYVKINPVDLDFYDIGIVNACSQRGGLTKFDNDEKVHKVIFDE